MHISKSVLSLTYESATLLVLKLRKMKSVFLVYKTDVRHSYASRDTIGCASSKELAIDLCKRQAKKEHSKIDSDQLYNLNNLSQTQGYLGEGEFHFEEIDVNKLI